MGFVTWWDSKLRKAEVKPKEREQNTYILQREAEQSWDHTEKLDNSLKVNVVKRLWSYDRTSRTNLFSNLAFFASSGSDIFKTDTFISFNRQRKQWRRAASPSEPILTWSQTPSPEVTRTVGKVLADQTAASQKEKSKKKCFYSQIIHKYILTFITVSVVPLPGTFSPRIQDSEDQFWQRV